VAEPVKAVSELERLVGEILDDVLGDGSAVFMSGQADSLVVVGRAADARRVAASTIKLPLLLEILHEEAIGELDLDEVYTIRTTDVVGGTGDLQGQVGRALPLRELARLMVTRSDNVATNVLLRRIGKGTAAVGMGRVNQFMAERGFEATRFERTMLDTAAQDRGQENYTSAQDLAMMLDGIRRGTLLAEVSPTISERAGELLRDRGRIDHDWLGRQLEPGWNLAHINGTLETVRNDAGIITGPAGQDLVLVICQDHLSHGPDGERRIAEIARRIQEIVARQ
jgi:beta-lactamase class A